MHAIEASNISKYFSNIKAIDNISFSIGRGERLILIGPNGAGKSTLLRLASGLIKPTKGSIKIFGIEASDVEKSSRMLSFVSENYALYDSLTVKDNLLFFGVLHGLRKEHALEASRSLLRRLNASEYFERKVGELSRGTKQKIAICKALMSDPKVLLLDEPTAFLDPYSAEEVHKLIDESKASVVYATQRLDELSKIRGKIMLMDKGRAVAYGTLEKILSLIKGIKIEIILLDEKKIRLEGWDARQEGRRIIARLSSAKEIPELVEEIVARNGKITSVNYINESLSNEMVEI
ncbi:MAG: ABC transporter ATP-binding protein [Candidatus Micrarchaeia archaeon]